MTTDEDKLRALRREIDAIDDSLHDLIIERTRVVERVREAKKGDKIKIRPAREAEILYRLMARHSGAFPKRELSRMWREMIIATLRFEGPFSVSVFVSEDDVGYGDLARDQYGSFTPMTRHVSSRAVIEAVGSGEATVGILPMPRPDDSEHWWRLLVTEVPDSPRIIARLPFIAGDNSPGAKLDALVVGIVGQEETGRDRSFLAIEAEQDIGFTVIESALGQAGFSAAFNQTWHDPDRPAAWTYLVEIYGFIDPEGWQIQSLAGGLDERVVQFVHLGGYATPLGEAELALEDDADDQRETGS